MDKISIIVPVYNVEKYLDKCVESIVNQTYKNLEIILVDDGSPDNCPQMCDEWAKKDNRIKVVHKKNGGLSSARNAGIGIMTGKYVLFVDSDDYIEPTMIKIMHDNIVIDDYDVCVCNYNEIDRNNIIVGTTLQKRNAFYNENVVRNFLKITVFEPYTVWNKLYKSSIILNNNMRFDESIKWGEDYPFNYCFFKKVNKMIAIEDVLYNYLLKREGAITDGVTLGFARSWSITKNILLAEKNNGENYKILLKNYFSLLTYVNKTMLESNNKSVINICYPEIISEFKTYYNEFMRLDTITLDDKRKLKIVCFFPKLYRALYKNNTRKLLSFIKGLTVYKNLKSKYKLNSADAFLVMTPEHGNLGDHAIAFAQKKLFQDFANVVEISSYRLSILVNSRLALKSIIKNKPILITGGGNLGTLWFEGCELPQRKVIEMFPKNKIIVLPNTIYYHNNEYGKAEFEKSKQIYNSAKDLTLFARELISYETMKSAYNNVYFVPDMVLMLNECKANCNRNGAMTLLRSDCEKTLTDDKISQINDLLNNNFSNIVKSDMIANHNITEEERDEALEEKFEQFRSMELVVTDRLHGMIFSAITGTPCIVLNSKSPKVKGVYDCALKDCEYILFTEDLSEMEHFIENIKGKEFTYDNSKIMHYYEELKQIIKGKIYERKQKCKIE